MGRLFDGTSRRITEQLQDIIEAEATDVTPTPLMLEQAKAGAVRESLQNDFTDSVSGLICDAPISMPVSGVTARISCEPLPAKPVFKAHPHARWDSACWDDGVWTEESKK